MHRKNLSRSTTIIVMFIAMVLINTLSVGIITNAVEENSFTDVIVDTYSSGNTYCIILNSSKFIQQDHVFIYHKYTKEYSGYFSRLSTLLNGYSIVYQESGGKIIVYADYDIFAPGVDNTTISEILSDLLESEDEIRGIRLYYNETTDSGILVAYLVGGECTNYLADSNDVIQQINRYLEIPVDEIVLVELLESYDVAKHDASRIYEVLGDSNPYVRAIGYCGEAELPVVFVTGNISNTALDELVDNINSIAMGYVLVIIDHNPVVIKPLPLRENSFLVLGLVFAAVILLGGALYYWRR
ncbi:MAG: hypothetical protein F7C36_06255 [Desulfurococcales archaeon]|nr:hypothetical protein [Desulfurococcales archaeon]